MTLPRLVHRLLFLILGFAATSGAAPESRLPLAPLGTWIPVRTFGAPEARYDHVAVWTGERMIVWGGSRSDGTVLGDGAIYDPATNTWARISPLGAPSPRMLATAVWTGERMIVWGGFKPPAAALGNGAAYDPATDTWAAISGLGAPSPRFFHTAVWTGTEMVVWGGLANFPTGIPATSFRTGAAYDPSSNTWRPTSTQNAPSARGAQVAVWTGERMIVWGGSSGHAAIAGGGLYDPQTDAWTSTASDGEPVGRVSHVGVWDGVHFLVWGGLLDNGSDTNTGGMFDPIENAWTPIPLAGAPSARDGHAAEALGRRLIVWSGESGVHPTDTGAIFDPRTGTWTSTALGAPAARSSASVVTTGDSLIFWGGLGNGNAALNSGGEYFSPFCAGEGDRGCVVSAPETPPPALLQGRP